MLMHIPQYTNAKAYLIHVCLNSFIFSKHNIQIYAVKALLKISYQLQTLCECEVNACKCLIQYFLLSYFILFKSKQSPYAISIHFHFKMKTDFLFLLFLFVQKRAFHMYSIVCFAVTKSNKEKSWHTWHLIRLICYLYKNRFHFTFCNKNSTANKMKIELGA